MTMKKSIELIKHHIHAGLPYKPGAVIDLDADLADWLIAEGAAQAVRAATTDEPYSRAPSTTKGKSE
jgi:hypothetical protein